MKSPEFATAEKFRAKNAEETKVKIPSQTSRLSRDKLLIGIYLSFFDKKDLTNGINLVYSLLHECERNFFKGQSSIEPN